MAKEAFPSTGNFSGQTPVCVYVCVCVCVCVHTQFSLLPDPGFQHTGVFHPVCLGCPRGYTSVRLGSGRPQSPSRSPETYPLHPPSPSGRKFFSRDPLRSCPLGIPFPHQQQQFTETSETAVKSQRSQLRTGTDFCPPVPEAPAKAKWWWKGGKTELRYCISALSILQTLEVN